MVKRHDVPKSYPDLQARLGVIVRARRHELGITQEELAWRADMHRTYIADIERGARNVTLRSVGNLAKALEVTVRHLFQFEHEPAAGEGGAHGEAGREILLVEDNAADAEMAERAFKRAKFTNPLKVVRDAEEALDYFFGQGRHAQPRPLRPQVILLDLNLPGISGVEFLRRIKADARTRDIPVVVLTVSRNDRVILECGRLGAANFIVKPLGVEDFVKVTPKLNLHLTLAPPPGATSRAAAT